MTDILGSFTYLGIIWALGAIMIFLYSLVAKSQVRVAGISSWVIIVIFGPLGGLAAMPLVSITGAGANYALPLMAVGFILSIPVIHYFLPALAEDFQTQSFGTTMWMSFFIGLAVLVAALLSGEATALLPFSAITKPGEIPT